MTDFPAQWGRTRRLSLGIPRNFTIAADGTRIAFLRTRAGSDPVTCLWSLDVMSGTERLLVDATTLADATGDVPAEERARRERAREASSGIVRYASDRALRRVVFDIGGHVFVVDMPSGDARELAVRTPAVDPRLDPEGTTVAYVSGGALRVIAADGTGDRALAEPEAIDITYGLAEFVAAEEMGRQEGYWWAPDGTRLAVARVDVSAVQRWYITDPANPGSPPLEIAYPVAGSANARVSLEIVDLHGHRVPVRWDEQFVEYLAAVHWSPHGLVALVQTRDQRRARLLDVDPATGDTAVRHEESDAAWVDLVPGVPSRLESGAIVWAADRDGSKRLLVEGEPVTDTTLELREVLDIDGDRVIFSASTEPTEIDVYVWSRQSGVSRLLPAPHVPSVRRARSTAGTTVLLTRSLNDPMLRVSVHREGRDPAHVASHAEVPAVHPRPELHQLGERALRAAILWPAGHTQGSEKLPVLLDPYGGPGHQRVLAAAGMFVESQWFADQGFAVLVIDGRGTPGRGAAWERAVRGPMTKLPLEDQVDGLHAAGARWPDLDLSRVAIRGWSYGGELAALAVLRRPDVFHAAVAGAPVTDSRLYDTHYTERYLGHPEVEPENYEATSLITLAPRLQRPLLLIHGLNDDNVVVANTLRLSAALVAAGREHTVLPLPGITHAAHQERVAGNLQLLELDFLRHALNLQ